MRFTYPGPAVSAAEASRDQIHPTLGEVKVGANDFDGEQAQRALALVASGLLALEAPAAEAPETSRARRAPRPSPIIDTAPIAARAEE